MALKFWNIGKANAEITSAEQALAPALEKAGIKTVSVEGQTVAYSDAPLACQITALIAANPPGHGSQQISDVLVSNELISAELTRTKTALAIAETSVATLTNERAQLASDLNTAKTSIQSLTVERADLGTRKEAAENQFSIKNTELNEFNTELSRLCIQSGCIELKGADSKPLAAEATENEKTAAANAIPWRDKLKAYRGAVNAAIAKTGAMPFDFPNPKPNGSSEKPEPKGRDRMKAAMRIEGVHFNTHPGRN